jgi:hypothetical protein
MKYASEISTVMQYISWLVCAWILSSSMQRLQYVHSGYNYIYMGGVLAAYIMLTWHMCKKLSQNLDSETKRVKKQVEKNMSKAKKATSGGLMGMENLTEEDHQEIMAAAGHFQNTVERVLENRLGHSHYAFGGDRNGIQLLILEGATAEEVLEKELPKDFETNLKYN